MNILMEAGKALEKLQLHAKILSKPEVKREFLHLLDDIYKNHTANITHKW